MEILKLQYLGFTYIYRDKIEDFQLKQFIVQNITKESYQIKWICADEVYNLNNPNSIHYLRESIQEKNIQKVVLLIEDL